MMKHINCGSFIFSFFKLTKKLRRPGALILVGFLAGCGGSQTVEQPADLRCAPPSNGAITDVQSVVDWINGMAKPLTLPCFMESLPRPLRVQSTLSEFSAQPSPDQRSPRIFFFFDRLILTVVVDQDFAEHPYPLLEMSYLVDEQNLITTKAELKFPVLDTLDPSAPYLDLSFNEKISLCSFCHPYESIFDHLDGIPIYQSSMLKPTTALPIDLLHQERALCAPNANSHRCDMLASIVDHGELIPQQFPARAPTIFDN